MAQLTAEESAGNRSKAQQGLILGALGVVYGDIGTSPLYTVKQCFDAGTAVSRESVLGVLSLIAWALIIVVALKYVVVIMRADNRGEGGILALTALALRTASRRGRRHRLILAAGLVGAALFYGDGVITPAISVLSAVEGLKVATPLFDSYVIPITVLLLLALFLIQRRGTARVGSLFGPVMALWFISIGVLGAVELAVQPPSSWHSTRSMASGFCSPIRGADSYCSAPWCWQSRGPRRFMRTWAISAERRSAPPGFGSSFRVCFSTISAKAPCC